MSTKIWVAGAHGPGIAKQELPGFGPFASVNQTAVTSPDDGDEFTREEREAALLQLLSHDDMRDAIESRLTEIASDVRERVTEVARLTRRGFSTRKEAAEAAAAAG